VAALGAPRLGMTARVGLTGSGGFLGRALGEALTTAGASVVPLRLSCLRSTDAGGVKSVVERALPLDLLVNCAVVKRPRGSADNFINAEVPALLAEIVPLVHVSTMNVEIGMLHDPYTESKREAERRLRGAARIVRPSLIWSWRGDGESALFERYLKVNLPMHAMLQPGNRYRPVAVEELARWLAAWCLSRPAPSTVRVLGNRELSLYSLFQEYAALRGRRTLPLRLGWMASVVPGARRRCLASERLVQILDLDRSKARPADGIGRADAEVVLAFPSP
jgi:dTDP-4-dehydrorhamnose reductase